MSENYKINLTEKEVFIEIKERKAGLVNNHQFDGNRDVNHAAFAGKILNKKLVFKFIFEANWDQIFI